MYNWVMTEETTPETTEPEVSLGSINIDVNTVQVRYESEMSLPEIVFWLEYVKMLILAKVQQ